MRIISKGFLLLTKTLRYLIDLAGLAYEEDYNHQCLRDQQPLKEDNLELIKELKSIYQTIVKSHPGSLEYALAQRLKLLISFFQALHFMVASPEVMSVESTATFEVDFKEANIYMRQVLTSLPLVKDTIHQGLQPPNGPWDDNYAWLSVFQPDVNRHLFGASFPKDAKLMTRKEGYEFLEKTFTFLNGFTVDLPEKSRYLEHLMVSLIL